MLGKADQNGNLLIGCHPTDRNLFHDAIHILIKKGSILFGKLFLFDN